MGTINELKAEIIQVIGDIEPQLCEIVINNLDKRIAYCRTAGGGHLLDILFKL